MHMRKFFTLGLILKVFFLTVFYFIDVAMISSGNSEMNKVLRSEQNPPFAYRITNELSGLYDFHHLQSGIESILARYDIKGASVAVARDGRLVYARGIGYADAGSQVPVEPWHLFRVASISKLITATTVMKMTELNMISLDDRVFGPDGLLNDSAYLHYTDRRYENITVRHLLDHSGGWNRRFGDHMFMPHLIAREMEADLPVQVSDIIQFAMGKRLHFNPGSRRSYSNLGYAILGEVISNVTGIGYEDYVRQTILYPLGIHDMRIGANLEEDSFKNEVKYYEQYNAIRVKSIYDNEETVLKSYGGNDIRTLGAAGGWVASSAELLKLITAIDGKPGVPDILSPGSIELMTNAGPSGGHTIGWAGADRRGNWWRTGSFAGTTAFVMRQNNGLSYAVLFNSSTYRGSSLSGEIIREMRTGLSKVRQWPEHDLFYHIDHPSHFHPDIAELGQGLKAN